MTGSQKHFGKGSSPPGPVPDDSVRMYSMRFCPFVQRAKLVLVAKGIKHEVVNINLLSKPDWFLEKNPFGLVPALETAQGQIIYESLIVCDYLDEAYPGKKLNPTDPFQKAQQKMILEHFSKIVNVLSSIVGAKRRKEDTTAMVSEAQQKLNKFDELLGKQNTRFFGGDSVSMIDYMIWPWFERLIMYDVKDSLNKTPHINEWYQLMLQDPAVKATYTEPEVLIGFFKLYCENDIEAGDYGL